MKEYAKWLFWQKNWIKKRNESMKELSFPNSQEYPGMTASASEDFALIAERIPGTMMYLSAFLWGHECCLKFIQLLDSTVGSYLLPNLGSFIHYFFQ